MGKKILYISCHETLEYDELRILTELGHDVFSVGYWMNPAEPSTNLRPAIPGMKVHHELIEMFKRDYPDYKLPKAELKTGKIELKKEFLDQFDLIINCWYADNLKNCLMNCKVPVIQRTIDIIYEPLENVLLQFYLRVRPFYLVRMSEAENKFSKIKEQAIITQCVEKDKFYGWHGSDERVFSTIKGMATRPDLSPELYNSTTDIFNRVLVGGDNANIGTADWVKANISQEEMLSLMQSCRVNYVQPRIGAAMTYGFIESLMCGCPTVTYGQRFNGKNWTASKYIRNGRNGWVANTVDECITRINSLMENHELAKQISTEGRETAIKTFDYEIIKENWRKLLTEIGHA